MEIIQFIRCYDCKRISEIMLNRRTRGCSCGSKRLVKTHLNWFEQMYFLIKHPSYIKYLDWSLPWLK